MEVSLVSGVFVALADVITLGLLGYALGWRDRHWRRQVVVVAAVSLVVTALLRWWVDGMPEAQPSMPPDMWCWPALLIFGATAVTLGFRRARIGRRLAGLGAVVLLIGATAISYNAYFAYYPTVRSLVDPPVSQTLEQVRGRVRRHPRVTLVAVRPVTLPSVGVTIRYDPPGTVSGFSGRQGYVYLPPAWFGPDRAQLPVILLLAGTPATTHDWLRAGLVESTVNQYAAAHGGWGPVVVMPDDNGSFHSDTECVDSPRTRMDTFLDVDVRRAIRTQLGVGTSSPWLVAGDSEGGTCALMLALRHPRDFSSVGDFGGETRPMLSSVASTVRTLYGGSWTRYVQDQPSWYLAHGRFPRLAVWVEVGRQDPGIYRQDLGLVNLLRGHGVPTTWVPVEGRHTFWVWREAFDSWLPAALRDDAPSAVRPRRILGGGGPLDLAAADRSRGRARHRGAESVSAPLREGVSPAP